LLKRLEVSFAYCIYFLSFITNSLKMQVKRANLGKQVSEEP
jgi:hypothetical protein